MYKVSYYTEKDFDKVKAFMYAHPFVTLTGMSAVYPVATHLPVQITETDDGNILLTGHMMKASDHYKAFLQNDKALAIFNGPHSYVSASWYTDPHIASTWDYITVHAKGVLHFFDEAKTYEIIKNLTARYEAKQDNPSTIEMMPEEYVKKNLKAIVGFEIRVESIENVFKLSQNTDKSSREKIIEKLNESGSKDDALIANAIKERL